MIEARHKFRIAIAIPGLTGESGGIAQSTRGLVCALGQLEGSERYLLLTGTSQEADDIGRYQGPNQELVVRVSNRASTANTPRKGFKAILRPTVNKFRSVVGRLVPQYPAVALSDGYYESLGCDVLHFPTQHYEVCALPTIYNPHDLQHLHYPQFWTPWEVARREAVYRTACQISNTVVVGSEWIKQDVVRQYGVSPDKVQIIPWAPPTAQYPQVSPEQIDETQRKYSLPAAYALYPAVTWAHKNHLRLLDALAELRDSRGLVVNLVCTGSADEDRRHWPKVMEHVEELNLSSQVRFLGFLSETDLRAVYRLAQFLVLPSLFEADSCPIHEAWSEGVPVASSNLTGLPDQVGDAGLLFDPRNVSDIADALQKMATDSDLREELIQRGYRRVKDFSWERTAMAFRAVYRRAAGLTLNEEDRWLLQWDWMREPRRIPCPQEISCLANE